MESFMDGLGKAMESFRMFSADQVQGGFTMDGKEFLEAAKAFVAETDSVVKVKRAGFTFVIRNENFWDHDDRHSKRPVVWVNQLCVVKAEAVYLAVMGELTVEENE